LSQHPDVLRRSIQARAGNEERGGPVTEFETHVQGQLLQLRQQLDAALAADEPDQIASLSFQMEDLQRLSRDNGR
jgi:hypothetical protein